jgi:hypothetical protein
LYNISWGGIHQQISMHVVKLVKLSPAYSKAKRMEENVTTKL